MILQICAIYDAKAQTFLQPFYARAKGEALRTFADLANDKSSPIGQHPEDYSCFIIGEYNQLDGKLKAAQKTEPLGIAIEFLEVD